MTWPISETSWTKQSKQNITRDIEIKNKLKITRGKWVWGVGESKGYQVTFIKDPDTATGGSDQSREVGIGGVVVVGKWRQLYLNNNGKKGTIKKENRKIKQKCGETAFQVHLWSGWKPWRRKEFGLFTDLKESYCSGGRVKKDKVGKVDYNYIVPGDFPKPMLPQ